MNKYLRLLLPIVIFITGCSKDFDAIFNGNDNDIISPIELNAPGLQGEMFASEDFSYYLVSDLIDTLYGEDDNTFYGSESELAYVINDVSLLGSKLLGDRVYKWPEIDFSKYSLVIGQYCEVGEGYRLVDQRAKASGKKAELYLKLEADNNNGEHAYPSVVSLIPFVSLYPKLPSGPAQMIIYRVPKTQS